MIAHTVSCLSVCRAAPSPLLQLLAGIQVEGGGEAGRMARRFTSCDHLCCRRMQAWFTDLAVHDPGLHPYECHMEGKAALSLKGRLPDWERALLDHAELRDLLAGVPGKRHLVSIYTVSE